MNALRPDQPELKLIPARTAIEAAPGFAPPTEDAPAPSPDQTPLAYLDALTRADHFTTAEAFLVAALPQREAVWWACRCVRAVLDSRITKEAETALSAAEAWTASPGDINRRRAMTAAEAVGFGHPAGCVALAAFLSGGSLAPPNLKEVPPPPQAFGRAVAGALQLAAAKTEPATAIPGTHRRMIALGLAVARGEDRWKTPM